MSIQVALHHRMTYRYDRPVMLSPQLVRLRPAPHTRTEVPSYSLTIKPAGHFLNWLQDPQGNWIARAVFPEQTRVLDITVDLVADIKVHNPFDFFVEEYAETFPFAYDPVLTIELAPFREPLPAGPRLQTLLDGLDLTPRRTVEFLVELNQWLQQRVAYVIRMEPGVQAPEETLEKSSGSCRDSAWLLIQILRHLGFAARFVSGYLIQLKPDVKALDGPVGASADFTDLHAWAEVYIPGAGWVGLDPTSGLLTAEGHIPLACAPEPSSAAPLTGASDKAEVTFDFAMSIERIAESPRVTKPYTDAQWQAIDRLGDRVEEMLQRGDVRLTMGGEPTFVSADDMQSAEWNTDAAGPTKRLLAEQLIHRLRQRFAPDGIITYGQGKWYPGESLPRWAFALHWREDGVPLWRDAALIGAEDRHQPDDPDIAGALLEEVAVRLKVDPDHVLAGYEDPWHYLAREGRLPDNVTPGDSRLKDPEERDRMARVFERGLDKVRGYTLPIQRWNAAAHKPWISEAWRFRAGRMHLLPGDSPMGFRLPLEGLPWVAPADYPHVYPDDPMAQLPPLPDPEARRQMFRTMAANDRNDRDRRRGQRRGAGEGYPNTGGPSTGFNVRTALCAEFRDGNLCLFMPPLENAADYLDLLTAIEDAAAALNQPVRIEGYPIPYDPRLNVIKVTPDPGVIEVNIQPARDWAEAKAITSILYEEARQTRLGTEKFMVDGRHVGTGGGNHIVLGGATPGDSPFLRRPHLLGSLIRYWQNHPSLSYLFSGLFIGPTSQAPRIDEARDASLYEIEIALNQLARGWQAPPPWLVDRVLRHLLADVTGNTHRTEICIDKLYSPDSSTGRLGLVEFRSFEMPPHAQMSLVQQLLLRALIARFWDQPYTQPLIRWGTALHDRFMLPHYVELDLLDVIRDLNANGFPFDPAWFAPHLEFRFPLYGEIAHNGMRLELRQALEPWLVLGEEPGGGGTVRYVDSSLERLQVKISGLAGDRYAVTCNGVELPLQPTGIQGEAVAGIRFRAWLPATCLHPTIGVHSPLVLDIFDRWHGRAVSGCTYHVFHPGGRNYETYPVNSYEAESRRLARFFPFGHTPGAVQPRSAPVNPDFPATLDMRLT